MTVSNCEEKNIKLKKNCGYGGIFKTLLIGGIFCILNGSDHCHYEFQPLYKFLVLYNIVIILTIISEYIGIDI